MNVLGVFAHPDDEVLGCGGTLAKHAEAGDDVWVFIIGPRRMRTAMANAGKVLGIQSSDGPDLIEHCPPDQKFDTYPFGSLVHGITRHCFTRTAYRAPDPDIVYTHHPGDLNTDHALTAKAVLTAFRPKPGEKPRTILACEVLSSTEWTFPQVFQPNWFEALTPWQVDKAIAALECYPSEIENYPHPRSPGGINLRASYRGRQCGADPPYAEAFQLLRRGPM